MPDAARYAVVQPFQVIQSAPKRTAEPSVAVAGKSGITLLIQAEKVFQIALPNHKKQDGYKEENSDNVDGFEPNLLFSIGRITRLPFIEFAAIGRISWGKARRWM